MNSPLIQKLEDAAKRIDPILGWYDEFPLEDPDDAAFCVACHPATILALIASYKATSQALRLSIEIAENVIEFSHNEITQDIKGRFFQMGKEYLTQEYIESSSALKYLREQKEAITQLGLGEGGKEL